MFSNLEHYDSCLAKKPIQTVQTQIRLLLHEEVVWSGSSLLLFWQTFVNSSSDNQRFICEQKEEEFEILEHLL